MKFGNLFYAPTRSARSFLKRWEAQLALAMLRGQFERDTDGGLVIGGIAKPKGIYFHAIRNLSPLRRGLADQGELCADANLLVDEGILKQLGVMYYTDAKLLNWYLSLFSGTANIVGTLTAATIAATMSEITSSTEGFSNVTRPQWVPTAPAAGVINNLAAKAQFNVVSASSITVTGGFLISDNARGGTTGVLSSASKFSAARELFNGETFELGYQIALTN
jgi:hypothetical protein